MADDSNSVLLTILNKSYRVNCPPEERNALMESARFLDERMYRIQSRGSNLDREQIAVMVALNIAHELLGKKTGAAPSATEPPAAAPPALDENRIAELEDKLERVLTGGEQPRE